MPYPTTKITIEQWESFYIKTKTTLKHTEQIYHKQFMGIYIDTSTGTHYAFTLPGHTAHRAWIARRVVINNLGIDIQQIGYYVGEQAPFAELFEAYLELNEEIKEEIESRSQDDD